MVSQGRSADCNDQLQSFTPEGREPAAYAFCQSDCALYQCGAGYAKHDYQRREQHLVAAACNLQEYAQRYKYQGGGEQLFAEPNSGQMFA